MFSNRSEDALNRYFEDESLFRSLLPPPMQQLDDLHWSPLQVVRKSVQYLVQGENVNILDIGSGIGKFCMAAAYHYPTAHFYGVEQREELVLLGENIRDRLGLQNVHFFNKNFTQLNLKQYHHFYFYNSFFENISANGRIDNSLDYSKELYNYYTHYLYKQLEEMPVGTRFVSYCSWDDEIPNGYSLTEMYCDNLLKCWIKTGNKEN
ncbi:MAG: methyltransferase domain-containing protein [Pseudobacter sp.]|uniref:methyltransferase domain-containing protein n=1 Tax=Pseudobacter sp. TaxID=2045420 RepID=UPI003F7EEC49